MAREIATHFSERTWALLVGVGPSTDPALSPLPRAANEVADLARALTDSKGCAVPHQQVVCLPSTGASTPVSKSDFLVALTHTVDQLSPDDFLFMWFSGHGVRV